jgi:hypothetical protein
VTKTFASNEDVVFMDVNLSEEQIRESPEGDPYSPGAGGWPTIRYFNKETGIAGGAYVKKTDGAMCDELGDEAMMEAYVEEYGNTSLCSAASGKGCDEREVGFIAKVKALSIEDQRAQLLRLEGMESKPMKPDLLLWVKKRKKILRQLVAASGNDEL